MPSAIKQHVHKWSLRFYCRINQGYVCEELSNAHHLKEHQIKCCERANNIQCLRHEWLEQCQTNTRPPASVYREHCGQFSHRPLLSVSGSVLVSSTMEGNWYLTIKESTRGWDLVISGVISHLFWKYLAPKHQFLTEVWWNSSCWLMKSGMSPYNCGNIQRCTMPRETNLSLSTAAHYLSAINAW
jgi:hypothetical protein